MNSLQKVPRLEWRPFLATKSVESPSLPLEGVDHIHGSHGLPLGVLGVGHGVTDDVLQEDLREGFGLNCTGAEGRENLP